MSIDFDAAVIGAGVVGLATARALAMVGKKVIVLESNNRMLDKKPVPEIAALFMLEFTTIKIH